MTDDLTIKCPHCGKPVHLTESLAAPFVDAAKKKLDAAEASLALERAKIAQERGAIEEQIAAKVKAERAGIAKLEGERARAALADELTKRDRDALELQARLEQQNAKLAEAQKAEADFLQKKRLLDDQLREVALTVEKQVDARLAETRNKARAEADESARLKVAEKDKTITDLQQKLGEALRKAEQGSQQLQGEVQELDLESTLRGAFPRDTIEPVAKGQFGGDALQRVFDLTAQPCGSILWESKRTRNWSDGWLGKLRVDQRAAKAELAVIVTQALPDGVTSFKELDGIWVTSAPLALALAGALRCGLIETAAARRATKGQEGKMELLYGYMTGPQFKQRVQALLEGFGALKRDLEAEKTAMQRIWAKRDKQLEIVMLATTGMYGDLQGIAGTSLPEIEGMDLKALGAGEAGAPSEP